MFVYFVSFYRNNVTSENPRNNIYNNYETSELPRVCCFLILSLHRGPPTYKFEIRRELNGNVELRVTSYEVARGSKRVKKM